MPIYKICNCPGCRDYAVEGGSRCEKHQIDRKAFSTAKRRNTSLYNTSKWRVLRREVLEEDKVCAYCGTDKELTVDHIIPPEGNELLFFDRTNLQVLCKSCHRVKTAQEINNRRK